MQVLKGSYFENCETGRPTNPAAKNPHDMRASYGWISIMRQYLAVDVRQGCHLLHIVLIGSNPSVTDVEVDAFVEQNSVLKG